MTHVDTRPAPLLQMLRQVNKIADDIFLEIVAASQLTVQEFMVLQAVEELESQDYADLLPRLDIDHESLAAALTSLHSKWLIDLWYGLHSNPSSISVTAVGRQVCQAGRAAASLTEVRLLESLSAAQQDGLKRALQGILNRFDKRHASEPSGREVP